MLLILFVERLGLNNPLLMLKYLNPSLSLNQLPSSLPSPSVIKIRLVIVIGSATFRGLIPTRRKLSGGDSSNFGNWRTGNSGIEKVDILKRMLPALVGGECSGEITSRGRFC